MIAPVCPFAAVEHGKYRHVGYTCVFNILDYTCLSFPCKVTVDSELDVLDSDDQKAPLSETDKLIRDECMSLTLCPIIQVRVSVLKLVCLDDPTAIHGMPVNLQLVGRRLEEEKVLMMGRVVRSALE